MSTDRSTLNKGERGGRATDSTGWARHLDALKQLKGLSSDMALASFLGVTRSFISAVRTGRKNVSAELGERIFDLLGKEVSAEDVEIFKPLRVQRREAAPKRVEAVEAAKARARAAGHCELCGAPAPFKTPAGEPYLEICAVAAPEAGGSGDATKFVALCPNCNRQLAVCGVNSATAARLQAVGSAGREL